MPIDQRALPADPRLSSFFSLSPVLLTGQVIVLLLSQTRCRQESQELQRCSAPPLPRYLGFRTQSTEETNIWLRMAEHASSSSTSSSSVPSFIANADLSIIQSLACTAYKRATSIETTCTVSPEHKRGSFNAVWFINFSDNGPQWVFRTPITSWSSSLARRMKSDIITMKLIQNKTSIPIPVIHDFCVTSENPFGRPYMLMDCAKGIQLAKLWFDPAWFTSARRQTVFDSLASCMAQLRDLTFDSIGCLEYNEESQKHFVGPILPSYEHPEEYEHAMHGPFHSAHIYLLHLISRESASKQAGTPAHGKPAHALLRLFAGSLPDETLDGPPFVLSMPDFNYQNVFVDEQDGRVTGLIDWDGVMVGPRQGGYARYPSWITRDWDPIMYMDPTASEEEEGQQQAVPLQDGSPPSTISNSIQPGPEIHLHPRRAELQEDAPATLEAFRKEYLAAMTRADPVSAQYTRESHIYEALEIAATSDWTRGHILVKLAEYVFGEEAELGSPLSAVFLEEGIAKGEWVKVLKCSNRE